jgi:cobyrinic acid a,c-diamide synthase
VRADSAGPARGPLAPARGRRRARQAGGRARPAPGTVRALCIAGIASSVGKTTVTLALAAACRRRGLRVRCAKIGPDFIDPGFHAAATGAPSHTLDGWLLPPDVLRRTLGRAGADADLVLIEGMMGLFDGLEGRSEIGSTAEVAKRLGVPVLLVVDVAAQARSAGAVVLGAERFDPDLVVAGVILNRVGGPRHVTALRDAIGAVSPVPIVGAVPWQEAVRLPERHLGLVTAPERRFPPDLFERLADLGEAAIDADACLDLARSTVAAEPPPSPTPQRVRIGIARDAAFQFYYPDSLDALAAAGAALVPWSPLADARLPDVDALLLGGGYPEVHAARLAGNAAMRGAVRAFVLDGGPVHAECGGLMYLARELEGPDGAFHPMVGVLPLRVRMTPARLTLGYREARLEADALIGPAGAVFRGHEFHRSHVEEVRAPGLPPAYRVADPATGAEEAEGYRVRRTLATYVHVHLGSRPGSAEALVDGCARGRRGVGAFE